MNDASTPTPITASAPISAWLEHPSGGPVLRALLERSGTDVAALGPVLGMPLQQLVPLSRGELPQSAVDDMVRAANGGEIPAESDGGTGPAAGSGPTGGADASAGRFAGRTVVVTGAAGGIGRATAERLLAEGARVVATDISAERLEALASDGAVAAAGDRLLTVVGDLGSAETIDAILAAAGERIDGLANVAGINDDFSAIHEVSDEMWAKVFAVNVGGLLSLTRAVTSRMLEAGGGAIVHVASEAGLRGSASGVAYTASKHAVVGITKSMAFMYAKEGISTNAVAPGGVATGIPMQPEIAPFGSARLEEARSNIPSIATAEQLASSILHLLSEDASNVNGAVLASDGGWSAV
ncbi:SDR family oxidoreductase [Brachybacterium halotolerans subsp. kimchii]|uniref:SDR family NAD(P)-dependent oxidoreductase n=1 Tax=Brachybacterium halotolerans TaxID=2795215 RepID=UPI001E3A92D5|nr:SDR family oxidoreductase [Brachybacterium halotolerans]UEJ82831.1 SDR family oxidoreductase [Brachybacterium halotolerans subsp. kimchii]